MRCPDMAIGPFVCTRLSHWWCSFGRTRNAENPSLGLVPGRRAAVAGSRTRPVDVNGEARGIGRRFDELELQRSGQILEQREPGAERSRLDHEPVLVDEPES